MSGLLFCAYFMPRLDEHNPSASNNKLANKHTGGPTRSVLLFCSATVALNQLVGRPTHPGIVDDYRKTFAWAKTQRPDVFLAPHPEMFGMHDKRAAIAAGAPNPFAKAGDFSAFAARLETAFDAALAKQTAALQEKK